MTESAMSTTGAPGAGATLKVLLADILEIHPDEIDEEESFQSLGADSFSLMKFLAHIKSSTHANISLRDLFENFNSISRLSEKISSSTNQRVEKEQPRSAVTPSRAESPFEPPRARYSQEYLAQSAPNGVEYHGDGLEDYASRLIGDYKKRTARSCAAFQSGAHHLANNRVFGEPADEKLAEISYPIFARELRGARIWDLDDNEYVDLSLGYGSCLFGHAPAFIADALRKRLGVGWSVGPEDPTAIENARMFSELTQTDRVLFNNSGTEAVFTAIRIARAATGRDTICLFQNSYHGHADEVLVVPEMPGERFAAAPMTRGIPARAAGSVKILPFDDRASLDYLSEHGHTIAAVLVEPVQNRRPDLCAVQFLKELRQVTRNFNTALISDEVLVGGRIAPGGAAQHFGIRPDMATFGKVFAGGLPIGIVAGQAWCMDQVDRLRSTGARADRVYTAGTFCKNPLSMIAMNAVVRTLLQEGGRICADLSEKTARLVGILNRMFEQHHSKIRVFHFGSFFRFAYDGNLSFAYQPRELQLFYANMILHGVYIWEGRTCFLSTAHAAEDLDRIIWAAEKSAWNLRDATLVRGE